MNATKRTKELLKDAFPSMWLRWHFMNRAKFGRTGTVVSRQDRADRCRDSGRRGELRPLHPGIGAAFETGLCVRAVPANGKPPAAYLSPEC